MTRKARDLQYMDRVLRLAGRAERRAEVPVGALVVRDGAVLGSGYNRPISSHDPTAHAEVVALRNAARRAGNYRLTGATLYVLVEPCLMCVGALVHARIARLVYGADDPKVGAVAIARKLAERHALNHRLEVTVGVRRTACAGVLQAYFRSRRAGR